MSRVKYVMVVQPSSMIYYDYCNMVWVQGPSSVSYIPVDSTDRNLGNMPRVRRRCRRCRRPTATAGPRRRR